MARDDVRRARAGWGISATILLAIALGGAWAQAPGPEAGAACLGRPKPCRYVMVHQGRLSVQLHEAKLTEVLAEVGRQAGIAITGTARSGSQITTRFTGLPLEEGLRRLLRSASQSSVMMYAPGSAGAVALREVRLFDAERAAIPPQAIGGRDDTTSPGEDNPPFPAALAESAWPWATPAGAGESDLSGLFRTTLETVQDDTIPPREESELARRLWIALEGAQPPASPIH